MGLRRLEMREVNKWAQVSASGCRWYEIVRRETGYAILDM